MKLQIHKEKQDTATPYITRGTLAKFKIEYPENPKEQTAIAAVLSKVDEAIAAVEASIKSAERLKKALMQNLLTGKLKPNGEWRKDKEFYTDEKFGKIPIGWEVKKLRQITTQITDGVHSTPNYVEKGIPFLSVTDLRNNKISFETCKFITLEEHQQLIKRCKPEQGDILMGKVATLGVCDVVETSEEFSIFVQIALIRTNPEVIYCHFLKLLIQTNEFKNKIMARAAGTTIKYIGIDSIGKMPILFPTDLKEQIAIADKLDECDKILAAKQTKIQTLQRLKKSLMQNLLTGKRRVDVEKIERLLAEKTNG